MADVEYYDGPVCYQDGWHYTVAEDEDSREVAVAVAEAHLARARKRGTDSDVAAAEAELADVKARPFEMPGERLHLEDTADGSEFRYRLATDDDTRSWHDRKHGQYTQITLADGQPGLTVTADELQAIEEFLGKRRGTE